MLRTKRGDYSELLADDRDDDVPLRQHRIRHEHVLEASILPGDTLASISIRFNCSVQDIKRLNKIDKDNEIFAYRVLKVPLTAQNILLDTLPKVHKSGQSSPNNKEKVPSSSEAIPNKDKLEEKLLLASVSNAVIAKSEDAADNPSTSTTVPDINDPLIDRTQFRGYPKTFGAPKTDFSSFVDECEINWIVLLFVILAVCIIAPLIYVYLAYEHPEEFSHHSRYDDMDPKRLHHFVPITIPHTNTTPKS